MAVLQVLSAVPRAGKTTVAVGLAQGLARAGRRVRLARVGASEDAEADARTMAAFLFAASPGQPLTADEVRDTAGEVLVVESDEPTVASAPVVLAVRRGPTEGDLALAQALGDRLLGTVATAVVPRRTEEVARDLTNAGMRPIALLPEDRSLAAIAVEDLATALGAEVLFESDDTGEPVENLVVAPVYTDPARPHFRRFEAKAILTPFYKTDLLLAALESEATCVVATGGRQPSHYVIDRARHSPTSVLATSLETLDSVNALADVWGVSRFRGERKAEAVGRLMEGRIDFAALLRRLS